MDYNRRIIFYFLLLIFIFSFHLSADSVKIIWSINSFGDNDFFYKPSDIDVDLHQSLIYIADSGNNRVLVFDFKGKLLKIIGNKGKGPAEFMNPTGLYVLKDSKLAVADYNNNRIQIFDKFWNFLESINTKGTRVADLILLNDKIYTISTFGNSGYSLDMSSDKNTQPLVSILDKQGNKIQSIMVNDFPDSHPFLRAIKSRVCMALSRENKIYLPYFSMNLIQVFDNTGEKVDEFKRPLPFKPIIPKIITQKKDDQGIIAMGAKSDFVTRDASFGPDGNLYLLTYMQGSVERRKEEIKKKYLLPHPMRIEIINPKRHNVVRYISCDSGAKAFSVMNDNHLVYIYEDNEGEITLKCIKY